MTMKTKFAAALAFGALGICSSVCEAQRVAYADSDPRLAETLPDQLIVKYRKEPKPAQLLLDLSAASDVSARHGVALTHKRRGALGFHVFKLDHAISVAELRTLANEMRANNPNIEYAEPDLVMQAMFVPNDPSYFQQWSLTSSTAGINVQGAWDIATGVGVRVAVLDTGYRPHVDLAPNIVGGYDFITSTTKSVDGNGRDSDPSDPGTSCNGAMAWHGTHVAGILGAVTNNNLGIAGVAFGAQIVPVRVLGCGGGDTSDIADAIVWASGGAVSGVPSNPSPARVLSLSLGAQGAGSCGSTFQSAINSAISRGSVVVVAAGNGAVDAASTPPGNCSGVVTVAATDQTGGRAEYSNFGSTVEIAAPGGDITPTASNGVFSLYNDGVAGSPGFDTYAWANGTSMATPHAAGIAALMLSANSSLSPADVTNLLQFTARNFPASCVGCGTGIVDAGAAVSMAAGPNPPVITDTGILGCNGTYQLFWNTLPGVTSYNVWRKTPSATKPSLYTTSTGGSAAVAVPRGSGLTNFYVSSCTGSSCGKPSLPASLAYYSGCP